MDAVLVIDDERLVRDFCVEVLSSAGFRVLSAKDAQEGLRLVKEEPIGVILLDVMMPEMSGIEALKFLREVAPEVPVIMITAYSTQSRVIDSLRSGAYDFLPKPFETQDLLHSVRKAMERHQLLQENRELMQRLEEKVKEQTVELAKGKQLMENVLAYMASGLLVVDLEGRITMVNRPGAETLRLPQEELLGRKLLGLFPDAMELLKVQNGQRELNLLLQDGSFIPLGFINSYLLDPRGRQEGVIILFRDLSEIKKLQEEIRRKDRLATIGEVAAGVAHEIRNPLFGISSVAQILVREVAFDQAHRELVSAMLSEIKRLNTLVEDLLLYGRPSKLNLHQEDLNQIWEEILGLSADKLAEGGLHVRKELDRGLPLLLLDGHKIRQVFLNLLKNAMEATPPGGTITLRTKVRGKELGVRGQEETFHSSPLTPRWVEISVEDTGLGIAPENVERIFDLFFTTKASGSGLGLPICRRIIEDHGGRILVWSEKGRGSRFTILLPLISE